MVNQRVFVSWLPIAIAITIVLGALYATIAQNYRQNANDPQVAIVEDGAVLLSQGTSPLLLIKDYPRVNITESLSLFVTIYKENGESIVSSGILGSTAPSLPAGVLDATRELDINKITWQIPSGERFAAVVKYWNANATSSGYILSARSLREVEEREFQLEIMIFIAWIIAMILTLIAEWFKLLYHRRYINKESKYPII